MAEPKQAAVIPRTVYSAVQSLKTGIAKCKAYDAIMAYAFDGTEPDGDDEQTMVLFAMAKALIDAEAKG